MSETRATTPVFPPGRYGRRRDGRRRLLLPIAFAVVVVAAAAVFAVRGYTQYGHPDYDSQIVRWTNVTESAMTIEFLVNVPAGGSASCVLRARSYDGAEVGRQPVTVTAEPGETEIRASGVVPTTARGSVGDVIRCQAPR